MLGFGLTVAAIGMGVVFVELIFLVFVINAITAAAKSIEGKKTPAVVEPVKREEVPAAAVRADEDQDEIIAVISAVAAYLGQSGTTVKAIRRLSGVPAPVWSAAGRLETMNLRQL